MDERCGNLLKFWIGNMLRTAGIFGQVVAISSNDTPATCILVCAIFLFIRNQLLAFVLSLSKS